jgi:uncharacterized coiled-coil protein SlyX
MKAMKKSIRFLELLTAEQQRVLNDLNVSTERLETALVAQRAENRDVRGQLIDLLERITELSSKVSPPSLEEDLFGEADETTAATAATAPDDGVEVVTRAQLEDVLECLDFLFERLRQLERQEGHP